MAAKPQQRCVSADKYRHRGRNNGVTVTTIVYAWLTGILAAETRVLRRVGTEPDVVAYLAPHPVHLVVINIVIAMLDRGLPTMWR